MCVIYLLLSKESTSYNRSAFTVSTTFVLHRMQMTCTNKAKLYGDEVHVYRLS